MWAAMLRSLLRWWVIKPKSCFNLRGFNYWAKAMGPGPRERWHLGLWTCMKPSVCRRRLPSLYSTFNKLVFWVSLREPCMASWECDICGIIWAPSSSPRQWHSRKSHRHTMCRTFKCVLNPAAILYPSRIRHHGGSSPLKQHTDGWPVGLHTTLRDHRGSVLARLCSVKPLTLCCK